jgi:hypothetical protein
LYKIFRFKKETLKKGRRNIIQVFLTSGDFVNETRRQRSNTPIPHPIHGTIWSSTQYRSHGLTYVNHWYLASIAQPDVNVIINPYLFHMAFCRIHDHLLFYRSWTHIDATCTFHAFIKLKDNISSRSDFICDRIVSLPCAAQLTVKGPKTVFTLCERETACVDEKGTRNGLHFCPFLFNLPHSCFK